MIGLELCLKRQAHGFGSDALALIRVKMRIYHIGTEQEQEYCRSGELLFFFNPHQ